MSKNSAPLPETVEVDPIQKFKQENWLLLQNIERLLSTSYSTPQEQTHQAVIDDLLHHLLPHLISPSEREEQKEQVRHLRAVINEVKYVVDVA